MNYTPIPNASMVPRGVQMRTPPPPDTTPIIMNETKAEDTTVVSSTVDETKEMIDLAEDIDIGKSDNPTISIGGVALDYDTMLVMLVTVVAWVTIWQQSGLLSQIIRNPSLLFVFLSFIGYCIMNVYTSGSTSGGVMYELNILLTVEQMISILFGTMVLFAVFYQRIPFIPDRCKFTIHKLIIPIVLVLTISSMWLNLVTSGRSFRALRKLKQGFYNIALALFIVISIVLLKGEKFVCE